jgi:hypothetical protein
MQYDNMIRKQHSKKHWPKIDDTAYFRFHEQRNTLKMSHCNKNRRSSRIYNLDKTRAIASSNDMNRTQIARCMHINAELMIPDAMTEKSGRKEERADFQVCQDYPTTLLKLKASRNPLKSSF